MCTDIVRSVGRSRDHKSGQEKQLGSLTAADLPFRNLGLDPAMSLIACLNLSIWVN